MQCAELQVEVKLALVMFVARFHIRMNRERMPCATSPDAFADDCTAYISLRRKAGIHLCMTPRLAA